ncbi:hypothetical protein KY366_07365 [Candidatus Woesearchaeota archaeon]|nr:hypothetical protein [Candidatus Woesearchaeota archaeon]
MKNNKKGAMEISVGAIVVLVLSITFLSLGLVFMKGMLGKMFTSFDEQVSQEPEPPKPTLSSPITLSRNPVKAKEDTVEVIKMGILNPSQEEWVNRNFIKTENLCGKVDGICFVDKDDTTGKCDTTDNAKDNDADCDYMFFPDCEEDGKSCLISNIYDEEEIGGGDLYCPHEPGQPSDPDCNPKEGVEVYLTCDERIMEKPFKRSIGPIKDGEHKTNTVLLRLKSRIPNDQYLCELRVFGEDNEYMSDLVVRIENE